MREARRLSTEPLLPLREKTTPLATSSAYVGDENGETIIDESKIRIQPIPNAKKTGPKTSQASNDLPLSDVGLARRWFQEVDRGYLFKQDNLQDLLQLVEIKWSKMEMLMQNKEEELNAIIMELRKNNNLLQDKCAKEESYKMALMDDLSRDKEARIAAERLQTLLSEDLIKVCQEQKTSNQKIASLNDMYKRLQEFYTLRHFPDSIRPLQ